MKPHIHIALAPNAVASVAPEAHPETTSALKAMVGLVEQHRVAVCEHEERDANGLCKSCGRGA